MANESTYLFLTGADMDPVEVRKSYPEARFVARGYTEVHAGEIDPEFAKVVATPGVGDVWGILLTNPGTVDGHPRRHTVTTDDGRTFDAVAVGDRMVSGFKRAVYAAARYWELPTGYTGRLEMVVPKLGVEPSSDAD
jgi:hypothetical protein